MSTAEKKGRMGSERRLCIRKCRHGENKGVALLCMTGVTVGGRGEANLQRPATLVTGVQRDIMENWGHSEVKDKM